MDCDRVTDHQTPCADAAERGLRTENVRLMGDDPETVLHLRVSRRVALQPPNPDRCSMSSISEFLMRSRLWSCF